MGEGQWSKGKRSEVILLGSEENIVVAIEETVLSCRSVTTIVLRTSSVDDVTRKNGVSDAKNSG